MLATNAAMKKWNMIIWCNITWLCCMALLLIVCVWYNQVIMDFLWFPTCIFILVLFRIQQHIAEPYFKIVSRTAQLRRLQVSLVRFQYVSRNILACEWQKFLLAHRHWGTFCEEERLRLSDRNSILMTLNLSGIWSEELIGWQSSFIVLAIVYEWQTKGKRLQRSNVNAMNL